MKFKYIEARQFPPHLRVVVDRPIMLPDYRGMVQNNRIRKETQNMFIYSHYNRDQKRPVARKEE